MKRVLVAYYSRTGMTKKMTSLGPFCLREKEVATDEGMRSSQTYGRTLGGELGA